MSLAMNIRHLVVNRFDQYPESGACNLRDDVNRTLDCDDLNMP